MRSKKGQFVKGESASPNTQFKKGEHWRERRPYWDKEWLQREYDGGKSAKEIADEWGITENAILYWMSKHGINTRSMAEIRKEKKWGLPGEKNWMYGKRGEDTPNWKGGATPERQAFYSSIDWSRAVKIVRARDGSYCRRCGKKSRATHIHHIISFAVKEFRADPANLVVLCIECHKFVHGKANTEKEFIREEV